MTSTASIQFKFKGRDYHLPQSTTTECPCCCTYVIRQKASKQNTSKESIQAMSTSGASISKSRILDAKTEENGQRCQVSCVRSHTTRRTSVEYKFEHKIQCIRSSEIARGHLGISASVCHCAMGLRGNLIMSSQWRLCADSASLPRTMRPMGSDRPMRS